MFEVSFFFFDVNPTNNLDQKKSMTENENIGNKFENLENSFSVLSRTPGVTPVVQRRSNLLAQQVPE
jgi:hypothetical protein